MTNDTVTCVLTDSSHTLTLRFPVCLTAELTYTSTPFHSYTQSQFCDQ